MKLSKKLLYSAVVLATVAGPTVGPVAQFATSGIVVRAEETRKVFKKIPNKTTVNIYKLQGADFSKVNKDGVLNENGEAKTLEELNALLQTNVQYLDGVTFKYYKVRDSNTSDDKLKEFDTVTKAEGEEGRKLLDVDSAKETKATSNGLTTVVLDSDKDAKYLFVESKTPEDKVVTGAIAVPFVLTLPASNSNGEGYYDTINVYPKNTTGDKPKVDKDVTKLGNDDDSYEVGKEITWFLKSTIPENLKTLTTFKLTDTLSDGLTFTTQDASAIGNVKFGDLQLDADDYSVTIQGNQLSVELTTKGKEKIAQVISKVQLIKEADTLYKATENNNQGAFLSIEVKAKINANAVMGKRLSNELKLEFGHEPNKETVTVPTFEVPEVHTGGKRFKKVETGEQEGLSGAQFELYKSHSDNTYSEPVVWTKELIAVNKDAIDAGKFASTDPKVGEIIVLKSGTDGSFEIKGLPYGIQKEKERPDNEAGQGETKGSTKYYLKETVAPKGYVISQEAVEFTVDVHSYYTNPKEINLGTHPGNANPQKVNNNKRPSIPNTGGIGTAIFVAIGAAVMAFAAKGMKRRTEEN
ncbi:cell wall surface anchor family protein [Streptococcus dysgalactiae subsp. equisimilis]|uniref:SpaH/EbpB family LPXTG-anchored major pilin n=1 Tax=Streptococcus dysgalactiae TaxID=1334 RepID=UPI0010E4DF53|nr:SpaH/EbpB family LPXTG-anchored major pilin [Streptococcus dysgalactiae]VTT18939.1 cell wall surface anchor family protein [Streptococcus dysgalactiae subsp. equisimilis]